MTDRRNNPFEDMMKEINEMIERMTGDMMKGDFGLQGYTYTKRPGEEPKVHTFGTGDQDQGFNPQYPETDTHIDVMDDGDKITVIADLPGVEKSDIDLEVVDRHLKITAETEDRNYDEDVELPTKVDPDSADASYNNGVLEVSLEKEKDNSGKNIDIK